MEEVRDIPRYAPVRRNGHRDQPIELLRGLADVLLRADPPMIGSPPRWVLQLLRDLTDRVLDQERELAELRRLLSSQGFAV